MRVDRFGYATNFNVQAPRQDRGCANERMIRTCETENAMNAGGIMIVSGQSRRALSFMQAQFEGRLAIAGRGSEVKSADREQTLGGNRIGGYDGDKRSPRRFPPAAEPGHLHA